MDKINGEIAAVGATATPGSPTASHASSSASISSAYKTHGVQKFCSKIRHKIEDNIAPRLTAKLYKSHKHSISMSSLAESTNGKYTAISKQSTLPLPPAKADQEGGGTNTSTTASAHRRLTGMLKHQRLRISKSSKVLNKREISAPIGKVTTNSGIICPALSGKGGIVESAEVLELTAHTATSPISPNESGTYVDSDEEYQLSLNLTKQSLEDEIFEELEKAAHDESQLNAVLKNFDRLLIDYNGAEPGVGEVEKSTQLVECDVAVVEAAAAAQFELLALEPPVAFADDDNQDMEANADGTNLEVGKNSAAEVSLTATNIALKATETMLKAVEKILETDTIACAAQVPQLVAPADDLLAESPVKFGTSSAFDDSANSRPECSTTTASSSDSTPSIAAAMTPLQQPPVRPKRLEKSKSSLAILRRNVYQSPDTPTLRNIRYALATRARSKSVWELTPHTAAAAANSKIPIFKALPLQKRSNSFCSTSWAEVMNNEKLAVAKKLEVEQQCSGSSNGAVSACKDSTATSSNQRRQLTKDARSASALSLGGKSRSRSVSTTRTPQTQSTTPTQKQSTTQSTTAPRAKRKSMPVEKLMRSNSRLQMERTKSSIGFNSVTPGTMAPRRTPSSNSLCSSQSSGSVSRASVLNTTAARKLHRSRDELLDKCLEKGQQILRKVESINTEGGNRKTTMAMSKATSTPKSTASLQTKHAAAALSSRTKVKTASVGSATLAGKIAKDACSDTFRRTRAPTNTTTTTTAVTHTTTSATKHLKYANEEKVPQPQLEFCKIIPPVLGETSDKHTELLVNVVQAKLNAASSACKKPTGTQQLSQYVDIKETNGCKEQHALKVTNSYQSPPHAETPPIDKLIKANAFNDDNNESDSDDSGHISNENDAAIHTLSTSTTSSVSLSESDIIEAEKLQAPLATTYSGNSILAQTAPTHCKSTKISELLEKFEKQSQATVQNSIGEPNTRIAPASRVCTAMRVAQVEAVQCIQTQVEFYPNYSKEVTIRLL